MKNSLLVSSMAEFFPIIYPILDLIQANSIAELSAMDLENSKYVHSWLANRSGKLMVVDDEYSPEFQQWVTTVNETITHLAENGLTGIEKLPAIDAWFLHGNPNWFTTYHELCAIYASAKKYQKPMVVFIHDVAWPCARRDWYSFPERIPEQFRQPFSRDYSVVRNDIKIMEGRGEKNLAYALTEGGEQNGVLTAIEDFFIAYQDEFYWGFIPSVFGLGILFDRSHPQAAFIASKIAPYHQQPLLANLEKNRIANYLIAYDLKKMQQNATFPMEENLEVMNSAEMEMSVKRLLDMLGDDADHPEIWNIFKLSAESDGRDSLIALANYIDELLDSSHPPSIVCVLTIAHAVCAAYLGNPLFARKKLEELRVDYPESLLVQGALERVKGLEVCGV